MNLALEVEGLCKSFGQLRAVDAVSLAVQKGQALALLGPNGSGKTTILRCVTGLLRPDQGRIRVGGVDQAEASRQVKRRLSYLPQQAAFAPNLSVLETIAFHARLRGLGAHRAVEALREAGLGTELEAKAVGELSGGMRQRLALAIAGMPEVDLMLLDEPSANLDPEAALQLRQLAARWRDSGRAILFATHVLADVEELADQALILVRGRAVALESIAELRRRLGRESRMRVHVARPRAQLRSAAISGGADDVRFENSSLIITAPPDRRHPILDRLARLEAIEGFETEDPSLEQIYISYVERMEEDDNSQSQRQPSA